MGSKPFNVIVVLFWLATMSWLVSDKVLPLLRVGEPPSYRSILANEHDQPPVCWSILWNDHLMGWAASQVTDRPDGMNEMHSRVYIGELPLDEIAPGLLGFLVRPLLDQIGSHDLDARSRLEVDPLGRLVGFESKIRLAKLRDAIKMQGRIEGAQLKLHVQSGEWLYKTERYLPSNALVGDALSPQARLPELRVGQTWTMPVYNAFRPYNSPIEILQARVERNEPLVWNGRSISAQVVVYRADSGSALVAAREARGKLWVDPDEGTVLKQEVTVFSSRLQFVRLPRSHAQIFVAALGEDWGVDLPREREAQLLRELRRLAVAE